MNMVRDIIVVGASLGGLEAICRVTGGLPAELQASLLVIIHTSAQSPRLFADIIGRYTALKASYGQQGERIEVGHIYFAPPDHHLTVVPPGHLHLDQGLKEHFHRPAADVLFRSAAKGFGSRVIGLVLTGGDGDGTNGFWAIKRAGGLCIVQEPDEARDPSMPLTAIRKADPDFRVRLDQMPALLAALVRGEDAALLHERLSR